MIVLVWVAQEGLREVKFSDGTTLETLAAEQGLTKYDFSLDGKLIKRDAWSGFKLQANQELWASQGVKGA